MGIDANPKVKFESTIVKEADEIAFVEQISIGKKLELLYRATKDGFSTANFHSKCDGKANTLVFCHSNLGKKFGGFTTKAWHSNGRFEYDPNAFIFSITYR